MLTSHGSHRAELQSDPRGLERFLASNLLVTDYKPLEKSSKFSASLLGINLGAVAVFKHEGIGSITGSRRLKHIRSDRTDDFLISAPLVGSFTLVEGGMQNELVPGEFVLSSMSKPFGGITLPEYCGGRFRVYHVRVSGALLRARAPWIDYCSGDTIKIGPGAGKIMTSLFSLALDEGTALTDSQRGGFGMMLIDAVANAMSEAPKLQRQRAEIDVSSNASVLRMALDFITCNLSDPDLDAAMIATHCNISTRSLYAAFASKQNSPQALIWEMRLEQCRTALRCHELKKRSIYQIASSWGFKDQAHFSRAYKARFGKSPREDRAAEQGALEVC